MTRTILGASLLAILFAASALSQYPALDEKRPIAALDSVLIEELTWMEVRDALKAGKTTVVIPTGGVEQNGPYLATGKHNYVLRATTEAIARKLGNALVAPIVPFVPEGDIAPPTGHMKYPGTISLTEETYQLLLTDICASFKTHGFEHIVMIGDSGGNQQGMRDVAAKLNEEWKAGGPKVYALTDYYEGGREHYRAWMEAAFGYTDDIIGSHAGISDTSQMLHVRPTGVRKDQIKPWGGPKDSGVSGDPMKATAEIGRMGIEFKINAALNQYKALKNPPPQRGGRGGQ
jgi:creatinine amidohydrolase/Fe(II)-dependent formamide hydrolase-like protein